MKSPTLLITGATGNVGRALLPLLDSKKSNLIAGSTRGEVTNGIPGRAIDFSDINQLKHAFQGVDIAFIVIPLNPLMVKMAANVAQAARASQVKHIVRISGAGADPNSSFAIARVQGQIDQHLIDSGITTTFLRPKNFMQNFSNFSASMIKGGAFYSSQGQGRIPFIDVRDIASVAATVLKEPGLHAGKSYVLTGPEALTNREALDLIEQALSRRISLIDIPEEAAVQSMRDMGMPDLVIDVMSSLNQLIAADYVAETTESVQKITGTAPRQFSDYAREYVGAWQ